MAQIPSPVPVAAAKVWLFQLFPILCCILLVISHVAASSDTDWTASLQTQGDASTTKEQDNVLKVKVTDMLEEESKPSMHQQQQQLAALLLQDSCGTPVGMSKIRWWGGKTFAQPSTSYEDRYEQIHTWLILSVWTHAWQPAMICKKSDKTPRQRRDILTTRAKWFVALMTTMNVFQWEGCRLYPPFKQKAKASEIALLWIKTLQDEGSLRQGFLPSHQPGEHEPIILWLASYSFYGW